MISLIIPTYNEVENMERLITKVCDAMQGLDYEILIVDDNSPDGTAKKAEELGQQYPVSVMKRVGKRGLSSAVIDGFQEAKGDILGVMDADLSHDPALIPKLVKEVEAGTDLVIGSRLVEGGGTEDWPNKRKLQSYTATLMTKGLTKVNDPMSGYFFLRRSVVKDAPLEGIGYKILLEILVKGKYNKFKEVGFIFKDRTEGASKLGIRQNAEFIWQILKLYKYKVFGR